MSLQRVRAAPFTPAPVGGDQVGDVVHRVCCRDDDLALCGMDMTGKGWTEQSAGPTCWRCDALDHVRCIRVLGVWLRCAAR